MGTSNKPIVTRPEPARNSEPPKPTGLPFRPESIPAELRPKSTVEEIRLAVSVLMAPGDVHELRVPKAGRSRTISGYFNDPEKLTQAALELDCKYPAIYITLNPVNPALLARACNRVIPYAEVVTSDKDILRRRWLLIDVDPVRPAGISSTDREHGRAIAVAAAGLWDDMRLLGFGDPVVCDSGNGAHLLYRIDAPNTDAVNMRVKGLLEKLKHQCEPVPDSNDPNPDPPVHVDTTVFNAARITKLYGTMTRKGDSTPDRPHRRSRILEVPEIFTITRLEARQ